MYGDASQFAAECIDVAVLAVFGFLMAYAWLKISDKLTPIRVSRETELAGLDNPEMGALGYPDFVLATHGTESPGMMRPSGFHRARTRAARIRIKPASRCFVEFGRPRITAGARISGRGVPQTARSQT